ncbi:MAG: isochorismatase family cysteine hydrolase [Rhizobiaceae bacterium]
MKNTATKDVIVLLEFQNQWTKPGLFNLLVKRELKRQNVIENTIRLTKAARAKNIPILQAPLWVDPNNLKGLYANLTRGLFFRKGHRLGEVDPDILSDTDIIIRGRTAFDAFIGSELDDALIPYKDCRILFAGFATDQCVLKTIRTALKRGYDAHLIADCSATFGKLIQSSTERKLTGRVVNSEQLIEMYNSE